jgi:hypothetical protein
MARLAMKEEGHHGGDAQEGARSSLLACLLLCVHALYCLGWKKRKDKEREKKRRKGRKKRRKNGIFFKHGNFLEEK